MPLNQANKTSNTLFAQSKFGMRVELDCGPDKIRHTIKDFSGMRAFYVPYETLVVDSLPTLKVRNEILYRREWLVPLALFLIGYVIFNANGNNGLSTSLCVAAFVCFGFLVLANLLNYFSVTFTQLPMNPPAPGSGGHYVRIMQGKDHDEILSEIMRRWKARMLSLFGELNPKTDAESESNKFRWLHQRGVIDDEELQRTLLTINAMHGGGPDPAGRSVN